MEVVRGKNSLAGAHAAPAAAEDMGDGGMMICADHPYRSNLGGICAFCLQEKLGKLVSSSSLPFTINNNNSPSSSSSPVSFTSDVGSSRIVNNIGKPSFSASASTHNRSKQPNQAEGASLASRRARIPFLLARRKKNKPPAVPLSRGGPPESVLKRSKSTAVGPRDGTGRHFLEVLSDHGDAYDYDYIPRTTPRGGGGGGSGGGFWSFLHLSSSSSSSSNKSAASRKVEKPSSSDSKADALSAFEESLDGNSSQFPATGRKVSRSRSVGCGSRSFSGDFFERISTGLGDCTLRRVESHCVQSQQQGQKIYKCGGIFSGFMMIAAVPSTSSTYRVSSTINEDHHHHHHQVPRKSSSLANGSQPRARSWSWAFASPMRAFSRPGKDGKRETNIIRDVSGKNSAPDLSAIPSLLTVGG
ncbi:hypothetical protein SAY87_023744 [Trapa incisa]|uniref:Uncharacterized protein n=1 Tax=Trapa incisa TaxID=236973 RepID=A0AAN7KT26_9MYRT|nr:hypothetical protein SAY87_023744 [Trapa incisa]